MKVQILKLALNLRKIVVLALKPASAYALVPLSSKFGFDRGTPIDRFWIESFLENNRTDVKGRVLEITDNSYTKKFGVDVTTSDVLDVNPKNKKANIYGDLKNLQGVIKDNTYDCILLTHVLGLIDEPALAVAEIHRILKPGGVVLLTSSCLSPTYDESNYWRFTKTSMTYLFGKKFKTSDLDIQTLGNVLTGQAFWVGMAQEELTKKQLEFNDPKYPCIVTVRAQKHD